MDALKARVVNGRLVLDEPCDLPEGTVVDLVMDDAGDELDQQEKEALHAALDESWQSVLRGEPGIPASEVLARLRRK